MSQDWNDRFDYLRRSHIMSLNDDDLGFLVEHVWHLQHRCYMVDSSYGRVPSGEKHP